MCLLLFLPAGETTAQTTTLVSNTEEGATQEFVVKAGTKFTTGTNSTGYTISSVGISLGRAGTSVNRTVAIRADGTDPTGTVIATLSPPASLTANAVNTFTAPTNTVLAANTTYWLVVSSNAAFRALATTSDAESGATGWSIGNTSRYIPTVSWLSITNALAFAINGQVNPPPPNAPTGLTATAGGGRVTLSWSDPGNSNISKYQYRQGSGSPLVYGSWTDIGSSDATTTTHNVTSLTNGTEYSFQVRAVAGTLTGTESATVTATPMVPPVVSIARQGNAAVTEGGSVMFRVTASRTVTTDLKVNLSVAEAAGSDFIASDNKGIKTVDIPASSGSMTYTVATEDDNMDESNGSVTVTVRDGTGYTVGSPSSAMVIINDDDATPSITSLATANVAENTTSVLTVMATDTDAGTTLTYSITAGTDSARFSLDLDTQALAFKAAPDFENPTDQGRDNEYIVEVTASDGTNSAMQTITVTVTDMNEPPVIAPQTFSVTENTAAGTTVGTVAATDEDAGDNLTYSITAGNVGNAFVINENTGVITVAGTIDHETTPTYTLTVQVSDSDLSATAAVTINVTNVNDNDPVITSATTASVVENTTTVLTVTATDADAGTTLIYSISGGVDQALFSINRTSGALIFAMAPDFEMPADQGRDNEYVVEIAVSDGTNIAMQNITVTVTDNPTDNILSFSEVEDVAAVIFPNPSGDYLEVRSAVEGTFKILSLSGKPLLEGTTNTRTEITSLQSGLYLVHLPDGRFLKFVRE